MLDYDLVIIGDSVEAIAASRRAIAAGLRVTLVSQNQHWSYPHSLDLLLEVCRYGQVNSWQEARHQYLQAHQWLGLKHSEFELGSRGIDVIVDQGQFLEKKRLTLVAGGRRIVAPHYVLALGHGWANLSPLLPEAIVPLMPDRLPLLIELPKSLAIIDCSPAVIGIAPYLARWGCEVTLISTYPKVLPQESDQVNQYLLHHLEAAKVKVYGEGLPTHYEWRDSHIKVQLRDRGINVAQVMANIPSYDHLNTLNGVNGKNWAMVNRDRGLVVNSYLQTAHPQIYGIGGVLGGYGQPEIAEYEMDYLLNGWLHPKGSSTKPINYQHVGYCLPTEPVLGRIGFNPEQLEARNIDYITWRLSRETTLRDQLTHHHTLWGHIYTDEKNHILGAELMGSEARSVLSSVTIAIQQGISLSKLKVYLTQIEIKTE
jgi:pyruvate/2-oxoglutarate dehydrogenase complex dihydrolipoamide dehydrogenase (E3) component